MTDIRSSCMSGSNQTLEYECNFVQTANALAKGVHAPFRQHSLTANLKCALDGSCRTTVIAHISSDMSQLDESVSTLRFTERIRQITTNAKVAEVAEPEMLLRRYERQACIPCKCNLLLYQHSTLDHYFGFFGYIWSILGGCKCSFNV